MYTNTQGFRLPGGTGMFLSVIHRMMCLLS